MEKRIFLFLLVLVLIAGCVNPPAPAAPEEDAALEVDVTPPATAEPVDQEPVSSDQVAGAASADPKVLLSEGESACDTFLPTDVLTSMFSFDAQTIFGREDRRTLNANYYECSIQLDDTSIRRGLKDEGTPHAAVGYLYYIDPLEDLPGDCAKGISTRKITDDLVAESTEENFCKLYTSVEDGSGYTKYRMWMLYTNDYGDVQLTANIDSSTLSDQEVIEIFDEVAAFYGF